MKSHNPTTVVIPTLNEETTLPDCLESVGIDAEVEIIVSDGGSRDRTLTIARDAPGCIVVEGPPGRGEQLNRGAAHATGDLLLFLHADCRLPTGWRAAIMEALTDPETALACFRLVTEPGADSGPMTRAWLRLFDLRSRGIRLPYGDQGFALRRDRFLELGGFPEIPLMEDLALARTCRRTGKIRRLRGSIRTSPRRIRNRPFRTQIMWIVFPWLFRAGVAPARLAQWYGVVR